MTYLKRFFAEKDLPFVQWELTAPDGTPHSISNDVVIEAAHQTTGNERKFIEHTIRKIDFANGDVNHFLQHLAQQLVNNY